MTAVQKLIMLAALLLPAVILETAADIIFKKWALAGRGLLFVIGLAVYTVGTALWGLSLKYDQLSRLISVFTALNLIAVAVAGVLLFDEKLTALNKVGVILAVISVILVEA